MNLEEITAAIQDFVAVYGLKLIGAVAVLIIGLWVVKILTRATSKLMEKRNLEPSLRSFLKSIVNIGLKVLLVISVLGMIGIEMTSFIAILGAAGLAIGMALSGTLQNFAGGVLILIQKNIQVGDYIEAQGYDGTVQAINIFNTVLKTPDAKIIVIPNGPLATGSLTNYYKEPNRRVNWDIGIAYGDDVDKGREVMEKMLKADERVLDDPAPMVVVSGLGDSSVNLSARAWCKSSDYWGLYWDINEKVYKTFGDHNLNFPYPTMDLNVSQNS